MKLTDKEAILLVVDALPTADIWHEINQEEMIAIYKQASRELARIEGELLEYQKLYDDVARSLNSANFKLSEIRQIANRERANTGLQADWATVAVCPNCKADYDVEQTMCISCGRPTAKA